MKQDDEVAKLSRIIIAQEHIICQFRLQSKPKIEKKMNSPQVNNEKYLDTSENFQTSKQISEGNSVTEEKMRENEKSIRSQVERLMGENIALKEFNNKLKRENKDLNIKIESYKDMCKEFSDESNRALKMTKELQQELVLVIERYENEITDLKNQKDKLESDLLKENQLLAQNFEKFKSETLKELDVRDFLCRKLKESADLVKDELKTAKTVLQNPRLRNKIQKNLKMYLKDVEIPNNPEQQLTARTTGFQSEKYTNRLTKSIDLDENASSKQIAQHIFVGNSLDFKLPTYMSGNKTSRARVRSFYI